MEAMVALLVLLLTCSFFSVLLGDLDRLSQNQHSRKQLDWQIFLIQLEFHLLNMYISDQLKKRIPYELYFRSAV